MKTQTLNKLTPEKTLEAKNLLFAGEADSAIASKVGVDRKEVKSLRITFNLTEKDLILKNNKLEKENELFKRLFNELSIENALLKEVSNKTQI